MVNIENTPDNYKTLKISIRAIIKNPEMLKLIPDYLKTKTMCKNKVTKLSFAIIYVPDQYKTQKMCEKVILDNGKMSTLYRMELFRAA